MLTKPQQALTDVSVAEPVAAGRLQVFGLRWDVTEDLAYVTLDEAMAAGTLEIGEVSDSGSVPALRVVNTSDTLVFLMAGEQLIGAKQDRVLNVSIMVPAKSEMVVPVSCVEAGRWGYRSRKFGSRGSTSHSKLRRMKSKDESGSNLKSRRPSSDQGKVWDEVSRKLYKMGSVSASAALYQTYADYDIELGGTVEAVCVPEGCSGVAFVLGGRVAGVDLFDKPATLSKLLPKLVKAYAIDALEEPEQAQPTDRDTVETWLRSSKDAPSERFDSPGLGDDIRIEGNERVGACLVVEDRAVHMELFPDETASGQERTGV